VLAVSSKKITPVAAETPIRQATPARPATVAAIITAAMAAPIMEAVMEADLLLGQSLAQL